MRKVRVLLYHRVANLSIDTNLLAVSPENFWEHMSWIKERFPIIRFDSDWSDIEEESVCITFDDGYRDNYLNAFPVLQRLHIPATIFVSTGNIGTDCEMWWDELERNLLLTKAYPKEFQLQDEEFGCTWNLTSEERRKDLYTSLHYLMKNAISVERRNDWLRQLREWNGYKTTGRNENYMVIQQELREMAAAGLTIGAHTVNHPSLGKLTKQEQYKEISQSKLELERILGKSINTFSYPFGGDEDYNQDTIEICKTFGFKHVAANIQGDWYGGSVYEIPRRIVRNWNLKEFEWNFKKDDEWSI